MANTNNRSLLIHLEEKISFLERHVEDQDQEIYKQSKKIESINYQLKQLQVKMKSTSEITESPINEKPPHY